jgi:hypothetical protein
MGVVSNRDTFQWSKASAGNHPQGVLECWSIGVLEYCSIGEFDKSPMIKSSACIPFFPNTPLLRYSTTP